MKIDIKTAVFLIIIVVLLLCLFDTCSRNVDYKSEVNKYLNYKDTVLHYKSKNGKLISYNESLKLTRETMLFLNDSLNDALKELRIKKPTSYTKIVTKYVIDTVEIEFRDTLPCDDFIRSFVLDSSYYSLSGIITKEALSISRLEIPNTQRIVVGTKKNGLLKPNQYIIAIQNDNPYMKVVGIQNYELTPKKRWFEKQWVNFVAGVVVGGITYQQLSK